MSDESKEAWGTKLSPKRRVRADAQRNSDSVLEAVSNHGESALRDLDSQKCANQRIFSNNRFAEIESSSAYSDDLRERVVGLVNTGRSCRGASATFKASVSSAIRWTQRLPRHHLADQAHDAASRGYLHDADLPGSSGRKRPALHVCLFHAAALFHHRGAGAYARSREDWQYLEIATGHDAMVTAWGLRADLLLYLA